MQQWHPGESQGSKSPGWGHQIRVQTRPRWNGLLNFFTYTYKETCTKKRDDRGGSLCVNSYLTCILTLHLNKSKKTKELWKSGDESGMCSDRKQQSYRATVFLYLCPLNFTTLAVFSRGQIATPRFVLPLPLLQHPVTHQLTPNPIGRLMKTPLPAMFRVTTTAQLHTIKSVRQSKRGCKWSEHWRLRWLLESPWCLYQMCGTSKVWSSFNRQAWRYCESDSCCNVQHGPVSAHRGAAENIKWTVWWIYHIVMYINKQHCSCRRHWSGISTVSRSSAMSNWPIWPLWWLNRNLSRLHVGVIWRIFYPARDGVGGGLLSHS